MEAWIEEAYKNTPMWANDEHVRIIQFAFDVLVLTHPEHRPMIWQDGKPGWMTLMTEEDVKKYTSPF